MDYVWLFPLFNIAPLVFRVPSRSSFIALLQPNSHLLIFVWAAASDMPILVSISCEKIEFVVFVGFVDARACARVYAAHTSSSYSLIHNLIDAS